MAQDMIHGYGAFLPRPRVPYCLRYSEEIPESVYHACDLKGVRADQAAKRMRGAPMMRSREVLTGLYDLRRRSHVPTR